MHALTTAPHSSPQVPGGFDLERVMRTKYRIDDFQETYFVIDSFEQLFGETYRDFAPVYDRLKTGPTHDPGTVLATDRVIHRGTATRTLSTGQG